MVLVTATQMAETLGVSRTTILRLVARGELVPVYKLPGARGQYMFALEDATEGQST